MGVIGFLVGLGLLIALFVKVINDKPIAQPPPEALATQSYTPTPSPTGEPTPPKDLDLTLEQYCDKLDSFGGDSVSKLDFIRQTAGGRVKWRAKVLNVENTGSVRRVALGSVTLAGDSYHVNAGFDHPNAQLVSLLLLLQVFDVVQVTGTISPDNSHEINGDDLVLTH